MDTKQRGRLAADATPVQVMYVARGRTVSLNGTQHGPGTPLELSAEEREHFVKSGFLVAEPPILEPSAADAARENPTRIGFQDAHQKFQGPSYR
jgi:hypothetical protein